MAVPRALAWLLRLRPAQVWLLVLLCLAFAALGDLATGPDLWFGPVYLSVICLAAWGLGWRAGQAIGVAIMVLTLVINGFSLYPYGVAAFAANLAMRFAAISIVVAVVGAARRAYLREWHLARTDALTGTLNRQAFFSWPTAAAAATGGCWSMPISTDSSGSTTATGTRRATLACVPLPPR